MATYRKVEAVVENYSRELAEWECKVKESCKPAEKERYTSPERQNISDRLRRLQVKGRQPKPKHRSTTEKDSFNAENNNAGRRLCLAGLHTL